MSKADEINKYYMAYCYICKNKIFGFGDIIITNKNKLKMNTQRDIKDIKDFIIKKTRENKNIDIENITIMDFRELEEEDE